MKAPVVLFRTPTTPMHTRRGSFMQDGAARSDRVIMVCSEMYVTKADGRSGGGGYERLIVATELVENIDTNVHSCHWRQHFRAKSATISRSACLRRFLA